MPEGKGKKFRAKSCFLVEGFGIRPLALMKGRCGDSIWEPFCWGVPATKALRTPSSQIKSHVFFSAIRGTNLKNVY